MKFLAKSSAVTTFVMTLALCCLHNAYSQSIDDNHPRHFSSAGEIQAVVDRAEESTFQPLLFALPQAGVIAPAFAIEMSIVNTPDEEFQMPLPGRSRVAAADDIPLYDSFQVPQSIVSSLQIEGVMNRLAFQDDSDEQAEEKKPAQKKSKKPVVLRKGRKILNLNILRSGWRKQQKKDTDGKDTVEKEDAVPKPPVNEGEANENRLEPPSIPILPPAEPALTE